MHQLQKLGLRPGLAQLLDHAKAHAAAAMHSHARRLIDGEHVLIVQQQGKFAGRRRMQGFIGHFFRYTQRRQAHHVARLHARVGTGTAFVHTHFTTADDAVHVGLGHAFELAQQKIVQPLARAVRIDAHLARCRGGGGFALYNLFHLRTLICKWLIYLECRPAPFPVRQAGRCQRASHPHQQQVV